MIVSGRFPPAGGVGGLRALRMARHLPACGWQTRVLALDPARWPGLLDPELAAQIPGDCAVRYLDAPSSRRRWLAQPGAELAARGLETLACPDPFAGAFVRAPLEPVDAVWTTGPPHSAHLVGLRAQRHGARWLMDYRDPWLPYADSGDRARPLVDRALERMCLRRADAITVTNDAWRRKLESIAPFVAGRVHVLPNAAEGIPPAAPVAARRERCTVAHVGSLTPVRDPRPLLAGLAAAVRGGAIDPRRICLRLVGWAAPRWRLPELVAQLGLEAVVEVVGFVPRTRALAEMRDADVLLLMGSIGSADSREAVPSKTYEYLAARRPLLALVDPGDVGQLLGSHDGVCVAPPDDPAAIARALRTVANDWEAGRPAPPGAAPRPGPDPADVARRLSLLLAEG